MADKNILIGNRILISMKYVCLKHTEICYLGATNCSLIYSLNVSVKIYSHMPIGYSTEKRDPTRMKSTQKRYILRRGPNAIIIPPVCVEGLRWG